MVSPTQTRFWTSRFVFLANVGWLVGGFGSRVLAYHPGSAVSQKLNVGNASFCGTISSEQCAEHLARSVFHAQDRQSKWPRRASELRLGCLEVIYHTVGRRDNWAQRECLKKVADTFGTWDAWR